MKVKIKTVCHILLVHLTTVPWRKFIRSQRARAGGKTACDDDCFLSIPRRIICHYLRVRSYVLWGELRQFIWLSVYPAQRLHLLEVLVLWQLARQVHGLMGAPLRSHDDASDLLYLGVIGRTDTIQVSSNLKYGGIKEHKF